MNDSFLENMKEKFADQILQVTESVPQGNSNSEKYSAEKEVWVKEQNSFEFIQWLKSEGVNHLADLTSYDEYPKSPRFHVVYELISMEEKKRMRVIVPVDSEDNSVESITSLWSGANWLEREVYDLMGIGFRNHPDLRRILLPPTFEGHPLKKDFIVDYRQDFSKDHAGGRKEAPFDPFGNSVVTPDTSASPSVSPSSSASEGVAE